MSSRKPKGSSRKSERPRRENPPELSLGIDLGATKTVSVLIDRSGHIVHRGERVAHSNDGPDRVLDVVARSVRDCLRSAPDAPKSAGIAIAAQVDPERGTVVSAPNLRWRDVPVGPLLEAELGIPVRVVNDARAATFAEWKLGAGRGERDVFCLVLGTGVGGSAVVGGRLLDGGAHALGEVGHLTLIAGGRPCHCPNHGCFEAYVGGWAIAERAQESVAAARRVGELLGRAWTGGTTITAATVFAAARARDALAERLVRETEQYLCDGAVSVVNAFNPNLLILAGGMISSQPHWPALVGAAVKARCQLPASGARVVPAQFGEEAGVVGAAAWARADQPLPQGTARGPRRR
ncbi:MAG: ROK family protein [Thermoplasmata archaeon]